MSEVLISGEMHFADYWGVLRRRKWRATLVALTVFAASGGVALVWPATYRSSATILIEEPDVPSDLVRSTVSAFADERLQVIQQRVMTTQNLIQIMDKFGLYAEERRDTPVTLVVEEMRSNVGMSLVSADTTDQQSGRTARATIAFTVSFDGPDAQTTQRVANELVTLYLSENQRAREEQASGTAGFLTSESQKLATRIQELEAQLAKFKTEYAGALPEEFAVNTQLLDRTQSQLMEVIRQVQSLRERQAFLQSQLSYIDPKAQAATSDATLLDPADQLKVLQAQYVEKSAKYGQKHPDVVRLKRQIDSLLDSGFSVTDTSLLEARLREREAELAAAKAKYGSENLEVKGMDREVEALRSGIAAARASADRAKSADNPAYIQLQAQLASVNAEIDAAKAQVEALQAKSKEIEARVFRGPEVERVYSALKREYDMTVAKYEDVRARESEAELAQNLERERMGERLSVIEPPGLPLEPVSPNRPLILGFGALLGVAGGVAAGTLLDLASGRVYGRRQLAHVLGSTPLAVVPFIRTRGDRRKAVYVALGTFLAVALVMALAGLYLHLYVAPLGRLFAAAMNRLG